MSWLHLLGPGNQYVKHYRLVLADTPELAGEVFRIRHEVYCEELGFEAVNAEGRERDEHDEHSRHLLMRCLRTGAWAGCIRLVLAPGDRPALRLPSERVCATTIDARLYDPASHRREGVAEISRLAIAREFRHRGRDRQATGAVAQGECRAPTHPRSPYIPLGLYLGVIALAHRLGIRTLLFLTEPRLAAHLRRLGFPFRQISAPVEHRGTRVLSMGNIGGDCLGRLPFYMRPLYRVVDGEIEDGLEHGSAARGFHRFARRHPLPQGSRPHAGAAYSRGEPPRWEGLASRLPSMRAG
jgi:N-acyl amino acid synthase of PEP-CTERM/exosortase system